MTLVEVATDLHFAQYNLTRFIEEFTFRGGIFGGWGEFL